MKLIRLHIENFGTLHQFDYSFNENLNQFEHENGWGKTTMAMFLKAMFYGLASTGGLEKNERKKYAPWNGGNFGGSVVFEQNGNTYQLTKFFGATPIADTFLVTDLKTNKETKQFTTNIGQEIFNVDEKGFTRSVFITSDNLQEVGADSIKQRLATLLENTSDENNVVTALNKLDKQRQGLKNNQNNGMIPQTEQQINQIAKQLEHLQLLKQEVLQAKQQIGEYDSVIASLEFGLTKTKQQLTLAQKQKEIAMLQSSYAALKEKLNATKTKLQVVENWFRKLPNGQEVEAVKQALQENDTAQTLLNNIEQNIQQLNALPVVAMFANETVTENQITQQLQALQGNAGYKTPAKQAHTTNIVLLAIASALLLGGGIAALVLGMLLGILPLVLGVVGGFVCVLQVLKNFVAANLQPSQPNQTKTEKPNQTVTQFLKRFYSENEMQDPVAALLNLQKNLQAYQINVQNLATLSEKQNALQTQKQMASLQVQQFKENFLNASVSNDSLVQEVVTKLSDYNRLCSDVQTHTQDLNTFEKANQEALSQTVNNSESVEVLQTQIAEMEEELKNQRNLKVALQTKTNQNIVETDRIGDLETEKTQLEETLKTLQNQLEVVLKTKEFLTLAQDMITSKYLSPMEQAFQTVCNKLELGNLGKLSFDTDLKLKVESGGKPHDLEFYSKGYKDILQFTMRMALVEVLFPNTKPFLILDDPFAHFDPKKIGYVTNLLNEIAKQYQIIYFTCHASRVM